MNLYGPLPVNCASGFGSGKTFKFRIFIETIAHNPNVNESSNMVTAMIVVGVRDNHTITAIVEN